MGDQAGMVGVATHIASSATFTLSPNPGTILNRIAINAPGTTWTITVLDWAGSGPTSTVAIITGATAGKWFEYDAVMNNGLSITTAGAGPGDITVVWH